MTSTAQTSSPRAARSLDRPSGGTPHEHRAAAEAAKCAALVELPALLIVALGRSGSSSLVRLLNAIPGYRISGETDNAWIYLYRHARAQAQRYLGVGVEKKPLRLLEETPVCEGWAPFGERASARAQRLRSGCAEAQKERRWSRRRLCNRAVEAARDAQRCHEAATALWRVRIQCPAARHPSKPSAPRLVLIVRLWHCFRHAGPRVHGERENRARLPSGVRHVPAGGRQARLPDGRRAVRCAAAGVDGA